MIKVLIAAVIAIFLQGCATSQTKRLLSEPRFVPETTQIKDIVYLKQTEGDCGPIALATVVNWTGQSLSLEKLKAEVLTPEKKGSLPMDLVGASRRHGLLAVPISGMKPLLQELAAGHPVIVLQNLSFSWAPTWHYSVVTGYDLSRQEITQQWAEEASKKFPMTHFEWLWKDGKYWGLVVLLPDQLPASANELANMKAAAGLELAGRQQEAEVAYKKILERWPQSLSALIGLGNIYYQRKNYIMSVRFLKKAVHFHPNSKAAKHNLSVAKSKLSKGKL